MLGGAPGSETLSELISLYTIAVSFFLGWKLYRTALRLLLILSTGINEDCGAIVGEETPPSKGARGV